jgi:hypothetical protein
MAKKTTSHQTEVLERHQATLEKPTVDADYKELRTQGYLEGNELGARLSPLGVKTLKE